MCLYPLRINIRIKFKPTLFEQKKTVSNVLITRYQLERSPVSAPESPRLTPSFGTSASPALAPVSTPADHQKVADTGHNSCDVKIGIRDLIHLNF